MTTTLWDTTGKKVVEALSAERRAAGSVSTGLALTLVVVAEEGKVGEAEEAAKIAAAAHPCRLVIVVRRSYEAEDRLDAEVSVGGRLGPGEAVVMRMYGRLSLHAESLVLPLLAPDAPVVTWFHTTPPDVIAHDPLGVLAERRVTDVGRCDDAVARLRRRAEDYAPGDTDLAWARATSWRGLVASGFDALEARPRSAVVTAVEGDAAAELVAGWIAARLSIPVEVAVGGSKGISAITVEVTGPDGSEGRVEARRRDSRTASLSRPGEEERTLPLARRELGELLAEELKRLDPDEPYADALEQRFGVEGLEERDPKRRHVWKDPAEQEAAGEADVESELVDPVDDVRPTDGEATVEATEEGLAQAGEDVGDDGAASDGSATALADESDEQA